MIETETDGTQNLRMIRGYEIISNGCKPTQINEETYKVPSQNGNWKYIVSKTENGWKCDCPDHNKRDLDCKHIHAIKLWLSLKDTMKTEEKEFKPLDFHGCKHCNSYDVVKNGSRKTKAGKKTRFLCKDCKRTFVLEDEGFNKLHTDSEIVTQSLDLYFKGVSYRKIVYHIKQFHGIEMAHTTIMRWVHRYTKIIEEYVTEFEPKLGDTWNVDEMAIKVNQTGMNRNKFNYQWLWNIMDKETRFLLSTTITKKRGIEDARKAFREAKRTAKTTPDNKPKKIITDGLKTYPKAFNKEFYDHHQTTKHVKYPRITDRRINNNIVERLNGTIREREKVMRGIDNAESAQVLMDGYRVYYNFVRPHMSLDGKTPAEVAGVDLNLDRNKWKKLIKRAVETN